MGLDFSYILYFKQEHWFSALQKVICLAEPTEESTRLVFPDHEILVPMETWVHNNGVVHVEDPEISFSAVLNFPEDDAIHSYRHRGSFEEQDERCPPSRDEPNHVPIGYIYLSIENALPGGPLSGELGDLARFEFGTPGTTMSILFQESPSIRRTFTMLLESVPGVCGVFNQEMDAVIFWWQGRTLDDILIDDPFMPPSELARYV